jgi:hypothetical protein
MLTRRSFIATIAGLPILGRIFRKEPEKLPWKAWVVKTKRIRLSDLPKLYHLEGQSGWKRTGRP